MKNLAEDIQKLLSDQKTEWELACKNFTGLENVQVREFAFDGFTVKVQFNPNRIVSSAAKVDKQSIEARPCFLCEENRPKEQRGVKFGDYSVLVNPFPIFPEHFTVPTFAHIPQQIQGNFRAMCDLAQEMEDFTVFYNGPKCGASAPDHLHFQAGNRGFVPIDDEIEVMKKMYGKKLPNKDCDLWAVKDGLRNFLVLESSDKDFVVTEFQKICEARQENSIVGDEPMMNVLMSFVSGFWRVLVFPRVLHRPSQYFEKGEKNILFSPASVDMGGVLITPLEKDFKKITKEDIQDLIKQVLLSDDEFDKFVEKIGDE